MKKGIKIALTVVGAAVAVVGAGLVGGTYGSYSNYQALSTGYNFAQKQSGSSSLGSFDSYVSNWNDTQAKLTADQKKQNNEQLQSLKDAFYKQYPNYSTYQDAMSKGGYYTYSYIQDMWNAQVASFSINYDYNADQGGVIAGSVLLAIGLVVFIAFLVLLLKKKKV